jgi:hypothetical protein
MALIKLIEGLLGCGKDALYLGANFLYEVYKGAEFVINEAIKAVGG